MAEVTGMTPDKIETLLSNKADLSYADSKSWMKRSLSRGEDLNDIREPGIYETILGSVMSSLINRPLGFTGPGHIRVTTSGSTIFQEVTQHTHRGTETTKRQTTGGVFGEWDTGEAKTRTLHYTDYNDIPEGYYDIGSFSYARDMANRPPHIPASALVITKRIGDERLYQLFIGTDVDGVSSKWERRKSAAGEWSEWSGVHTDISRSEVVKMTDFIDANKVVIVGDSQVGASYAWANLLSGVSGQSVINEGVGGYTPDEALINSGVRKMVTTTTVTLPPSTDVPITVVEPPIVAKNRSRAWLGYIDGKSIEFKYSDPLQTFALRNRGSTTVEVPTGSTWTPSAYGNRPDYRRIVWFGGNSIRNNTSQPWETPAEHVMRAYSDAISEWGDTTVVCGYVPAYSDADGRDAADELNTWLHRVVPTQFLNMRYRLQLAAPDILGRALTSSEKQDIADGYLPRPLYRSDLVHLTDEAHVKIADIVAEFPQGASPQISIRSKPAPVVSLTGTGSPEGKVAAPVGSTYTDTAATNGAIRWIKSSGTGNTGWGVEYGDTGWRDISGLLSPGWTADIFMIRRQGDMVYLRHRSLSPGVDAPPTIITFPAGFADIRETCTLSPRGSGNEATINNSRELQANVSGWGSLGTYSTHTATIPTPGLSWPAALPGTPA